MVELLLVYIQPKVHSWVWEERLLIMKTQIQVQPGVLVHHSARTQVKDPFSSIT